MEMPASPPDNESLDITDPQNLGEWCSIYKLETLEMDRMEDCVVHYIRSHNINRTIVHVWSILLSSSVYQHVRGVRARGSPGLWGEINGATLTPV